MMVSQSQREVERPSRQPMIDRIPSRGPHESPPPLFRVRGFASRVEVAAQFPHPFQIKP